MMTRRRNPQPLHQVTSPPGPWRAARGPPISRQPAALVLAPLILLLPCASSHRAAAETPAGKHDDPPPQPAAVTPSHVGGAPDRPAGALDHPAGARLIRV